MGGIMKTFDTHEQVKALKEVGFKESQAEVIIKSILKAKDYDLDILATREELDNFNNKTKERIDGLEKRIDERIKIFEKKTDGFVTKEESEAELHELQVRNIQWMIGSMIAFSGVIIAAIKVLS